MKKLFTLFVLLLIAVLTITAQPPQAFKYKAVARDKYGRLLVNQQVAIRISILQGSESGMAVYVETHTPYSNAFGIIDLDIGRGKSERGTLAAIDWGMTDYYIKIEMDPKCKPKREYTVIGTSQLLSVPYALYSGHVQNSEDNDTDPLNEVITNAYLSGMILTILEGGNTTLIDLSGLQEGFEDADADPENEIQDLQLNGNILTITKNGTATQIDLSLYFDNTDNQQLTITGQELSIQNGNTVILPDRVDDADHDPANEIQELSLTGDELSLTLDASPVDLAKYLDNTDNQNLSIDGHLLTIANGNTVQLPDSVNDADHDPTNELITNILLNGTQLEITEAGVIKAVDLEDLSSNTSGQTLSSVLAIGNDAGTNIIKNLADPVNEKDAATKAYVDSVSSHKDLYVLIDSIYNQLNTSIQQLGPSPLDPPVDICNCNTVKLGTPYRMIYWKIIDSLVDRVLVFDLYVTVPDGTTVTYSNLLEPRKMLNLDTLSGSYSCLVIVKDFFNHIQVGCKLNYIFD
jgi:hypothetical protein